MGQILLFIGVIFLLNYFGTRLAGDHKKLMKGKCEGQHKWEYNADGFLQCSNCNKFPGGV